MQLGELARLSARRSERHIGPRYADLVLANPPFGRKSSVTIAGEDGRESREAQTVARQDFWATTVVPDNVLFEGGAGETIRRPCRAGQTGQNGFPFPRCA
jgi:type I restriction-modification system DNA methylase subunit